MSLLGKRSFLSADVPFLLGRYPDRPAPTHVMNALLVGAFGEGPAADFVRDILRAEEMPSPLTGVASSLYSTPDAREAFRNAARLIFDPDSKVFPSVGSPFAIHPGALASDPSDDGFGRQVWSLLSSVHKDARAALQSLYSDLDGADGVTAFADVLCGGYRLGAAPRRPRRDSNTSDFHLPGRLGEVFTASLRDLALRPIEAPQHFTRSLRIAAATRGVFSATFFAALRSPEFVARAPDSWGDLSPMFVLGDVPPGRVGSPEVRLASRSYEQLVAEVRNSLAAVLDRRLKKRRVNAPPSQYARVLLAAAFDLDDRTLEEAADLLGRSMQRDTIVQRLMSATYPPGHLERGYRSMGAKVGLAGPDRGTGSPRLLFETPVLALLVDVTLGADERLAYEDWLDRLYENFGIIIGRGREHDFEALLTSLDARGPVSRALDSNHDALRRRMIRAGLAVEYSDTETEVFRSAP